ncbi:hypothetical protein D3C87_1148990 [compost metagenome]
MNEIQETFDAISADVYRAGAYAISFLIMNIYACNNWRNHHKETIENIGNYICCNFGCLVGCLSICFAVSKSKR